MDLARRDEFVPKIPFQPDAQPDIFLGHAGSVANGYTSAQREQLNMKGNQDARVSGLPPSHIPA